MGGKQLSSTDMGYKEAAVKVYPPVATTSTGAASTEATEVKPTLAAASTEANGTKSSDITDSPVAAEESDPEPVGE